MSEELPHIIEHDSERIPSPEEVHETIKQMLKGREFEETNKLTDEQGNIYYLTAMGQMEDGSPIEFYFKLKGEHPNGDSNDQTMIHSFIEQDTCGGTAGPQATLIDCKWVIID